jgi:hypothetical protein
MNTEPRKSCWDRIVERRKKVLPKGGIFKADPETYDAAYRKILMEELPDGMYEIGGEGMTAFTGKGGFVEYEIALLQQLREMLKEKK